MQQPSPATRLEPSRLLVRGVNWLGDAVMTTPALGRLRQRFPKTRITMLADESIAELWDGHPCVDDLIKFKRSQGLWSVAARLRNQDFDTALIFPNSPRSALESWMAGIPHRIGYAGRWRSWLLTRSIHFPPGYLQARRRGIGEIRRLLQESNAHGVRQETRVYTHQVHDYLRLAAALGADPSPLPPKLEVSAAELQSARIRLSQLLPKGKPGSPGQAPVWLGLNVSAAYGPAKCWPLERFAAAARDVSRRLPDCVWISFGTAADWESGERLAGMAGCSIVNLAGKTSLRELMALLRECRVLLTNDSGPMHVAAALGTPVVAPFGSTSPDLTGPGEPGEARHHLVRGNAACSPCFRRTCPVDFRCMTSISVEQVTHAVLDSFGQK